MSLSRKQAATLGAALSFIRDRGYDVNPIIGEIKARERNGTPARRAYEATLNRFVAQEPGMLAPLQRVTRLVEESGVSLVAHYNVALRTYLETGDESRLNALAPVIAKGMTELAAKNGETAPEFSEEVSNMLAAANEPIAPPATETHVNSSQARPASFAFTAPTQAGLAEA